MSFQSFHPDLGNDDDKMHSQLRGDAADCSLRICPPAVDAQPAQDRLSILPPELLSLIFEQVRLLNQEEESRKQMLGCISKSLLPYTRANFWHSIRIPSLPVLERFWKVIQESDKSEIAGMVYSLALGPNHGRGSWTKAKAATLLLRLPRLKKLELIKTAGFSQAILSSEVAGIGLECLEDLSFYDPHCLGNDWSVQCCIGNPLSPGCYEMLSRYKRLTKITVVSDFDGALGEVDYGGKKNGGVKHLTTIGDLHDIEPSLTPLLGHFDQLETLDLAHENGRPFPNFLWAVTPNLRHLSLDIGRQQINTSLDLPDDSICHLTNLVTLTLNVVNFTPVFLSLLSDFEHLEEINFGPSTRDLTLIELKPLIGSRRPKLLRAIAVDNVKRNDGGTLVGIQDVDLNRVISFLPKWPVGLSFHNAVEFITLAEGNGIAISGAILHGIEVEKEILIALRELTDSYYKNYNTQDSLRDNEHDSS